jgi:DNA-binding transcriptional LysR family regulator
MNLDPRRLRVLREVALRGTITAAADALGYTPSAISQQLSALARASEPRLVERAGRRVRLTEAGELLVARTEPVLTALEEAQAALERWRETIGGDLRVAAAGSVARELVIPVAAELAGEHADLRVTVRESEPDGAMVALRLGELDVAVVHEYDLERRPAPEEIERVELFTEEMRLAAGTGRFGEPVELGALAGEVWAAEPAETSCGRALRTACRAAGFEPDVRHRANDVALLLQMAADGHGVTLVPALGQPESHPGVAIRPVAGPDLERRLFAAVRRGTARRPALAATLDALRARAAAIGLGPVRE